MTKQEFKDNFLKYAVFNKSIYRIIGYKYWFDVKTKETKTSIILLDKNKHSILETDIKNCEVAKNV